MQVGLSRLLISLCVTAHNKAQQLPNRGDTKMTEKRPKQAEKSGQQGQNNTSNLFIVVTEFSPLRQHSFCYLAAIKNDLLAWLRLPVHTHPPINVIALTSSVGPDPRSTHLTLKKRSLLLP